MALAGQGVMYEYAHLASGGDASPVLLACRWYLEGVKVLPPLRGRISFLY